MIALVITIIVLLILAGVGINLVAGRDGILGKDSNAIDINNKETAKEQVNLKIAEYQTEYYDEMYFKKSISVNTKMGDWIAENKTGEINTENYTFTITGSSPYTVTIKKDNTLKEDIVGSLSEDGELAWASSGGVQIPEGLGVGSEVTYTPSGTYTEWTGDHSGNIRYNYSLASGSSYTDSSRQTDMTISNWKVFKINESTGEVQLVASSPTTNSLGLHGANGYNNGVKLLNDACSSLYGNSSKNIIARSINIEDIESVLDYDPTTSTYGQQHATAYTVSNAKYPNIYAEEIDSVIIPTPTGKNKILGRNDAGSKWISGSTTAGEGIQPYQSFYKLINSDFNSKLETADNGKAYSDLLLPNTSSTNYWVASRSINLGWDDCFFAVRSVNYGTLDESSLLCSKGGVYGSARPLFPVVSLSAELMSGDASTGFSVK